MIEHTPHAILLFLYIAFGISVYRVFCKLVWLSNSIDSEKCEYVERLHVKLIAVLMWPVLIMFMAN